MSDYDEWAATYDESAPHMTEDVPWYVGLARTADEPIVELGVGTGRVAIPIARETGKRVIGIDSSPAMLAIARERGAGLPLDLREGDMRELALDDPVSLVICPARALLHLPTWTDRRRTFERVAAALRPGGRFAFNVFVFDHRIACGLDGTPVDQGGVAVTNRYFPADNRVEMEREGGVSIKLWWVARSEWEGLLDVAGLETESLHGWFDGRPYDEDAREMVWVAHKPS